MDEKKNKNGSLKAPPISLILRRLTAPWGALWQHCLGRRVCHRDLGHVSGILLGHRKLVFYAVWWAGTCVTGAWAALWQHLLGHRVCHRDLGHVSGAWWDRRGRRRFVLYVVWCGGRLRFSGVGRVMEAFLRGVVCATATWDTLAVFGGASQGPTPPACLRCLVGQALFHSGVGRIMAAFLGASCVPPRPGTR